MSRRAVFLDRDGVINRAVVREGRPYPPASPAELEILPGVEEALALLLQAGFDLIVVSNQPDVARGSTPRSAVEAINTEIGRRLPLSDFRMCFHDDGDGCECRKPAPGMLTAAASELGLDLKASFMVGDRWRDVEAGRRAGCTTLFVDYGYRERQPENCDHHVDSLAAAARIILAREPAAPGTSEPGDRI